MSQIYNLRTSICN